MCSQDHNTREICGYKRQMHTDEQSSGDVKPRQLKLIHFSNGEILSEEEEEEDELHQAFGAPGAGNWKWKDYSWFLATQFVRNSLRICDFLGEKMAGLLGLNAAKYQYAIDQYHRDHQNEAEEVLSMSTRENQERINLSQIVNKPYGAINVQDNTKKQTSEETPQHEREHKEKYNCNDVSCDH
ncbi:protein FAM177A1 [Myxocyprinus asiaticus]|uniref:protein FAM177A1 n=1 Tax=Myxocyprinus asiaticus TaxID=70543 RepID=UPI002221B557|nr:protein FAM177A1 [Myxocyprinus asiaticus]